MKAFWNSKKPLCQQDILDHVKENGDLFWKERSIFAIINSLMKKGCIKEDGMVRAGKTYARTFAPAMSRAEFYAGMVTNATVVGLNKGLLPWRFFLLPRTIYLLHNRDMCWLCQSGMYSVLPRRRS